MTAVLVVRPSSLGDIVYAMALVSDVRRQRPELEIDWVAERSFVTLVELDQRVRTVIPLDLRNWRARMFSPSTWQEMAVLHRAIASKPYVAVLDLQEQVKGALIARLAHGPRHGFDRTTIREPIAALFDDVHHRVPRDLHFVQRCRTLAAGALGYAISGAPRWELRPPRSAAAAQPARYAVALHMTTRAAKLWPEANWRTLLQHLGRAGFVTLLPWGSAEEGARSRRLAEGIESAQVPDRMALPHIARMLLEAAVVVGVDTGLTHLAAALQTPTVALFTQTDAKLAGVACTGNGRDLGGNGVVPSPDEAIAALSALLRARPSC